MWQNYANASGSWTVSATQGGAPTPHTVTSFAYCAKKVNITSVSGTAVLPAAGVDSPSVSAISPACATNRKMIAGGFNHTPVSFPSPVYFIDKSQPSGAQWAAGATSASIVPATMGAIGYCLK